MFLVSKKELVLYLLRAFFLGGFIGFSYLLFGFFRLAFQRIAGRKRKLFYCIGLILPDLLFCLTAAFLNILMIYSANRGQVRLVALMAELLGLLGPLALRQKAYQLEKRILRALYRALIAPVRKVIGIQVEKLKAKVRLRKLKELDKQTDRLLEKAASENVRMLDELLFGK